MSYYKPGQRVVSMCRETQARNFYACCFVFCVQASLAYFILDYVVFSADHFTIVTPNLQIYLCRFLCSLLLHMELVPDVKQSFWMMRYLNTHPHKFSQQFVPYLIALMQFTGGLLAEITNIFMLSTRESVEECVTFFVAFNILAKIDNIYAESLSNQPLMKVTEQPLVWELSGKSVPFGSRSRLHKWIRINTVLLDRFYYTFYYYFFPFIVNFIPYVWPGGIQSSAAEH